VRLEDVHRVPSFGSAAALHGSLAALAAVLPEKVGDRSKGLVVGGVKDGLSLTPDRDETGVDEAIEMVVQGRPGNVETLLQLGRRHAFRTRLDDGPEEGEARDVAQSCELVGMAFDLRHIYVSSYIGVFVKAGDEEGESTELATAGPVSSVCAADAMIPPMHRALAPSVATALTRFRAALDARLGARVREVVLFGSHARGTATEASDVDVYVVIDDAVHDDRKTVFDIAYDVDASAPGDDGWVGLEPVVHSTAQAADMRSRERGLLRNIDSEGIRL
jgi:predicted nucleotidyltransferase